MREKKISLAFFSRYDFYTSLMIDKFTCLKEFRKALKEVISLLSMAKGYDEAFNRYKANILLKSSLILLLTKFETFLENLISEYIEIFNNRNCIKTDELILQHAIEALSSFQNIDKKKKIEILKSIASLWHQKESKITISNKFNYGKHGSNNIQDLFKRIGFSSIFDCIEIFDTKNIFKDDDAKVSINFTDKFNEIVAKRNNIIHEDASINFTIEDIKKYGSYFYQFSQQAETLLRQDIEKKLPLKTE